MVRKTVAEVKTTGSHTKHEDNANTFDFEGMIKKIWSDLQDNRMSILGFLLILIGLIQLREFIAGVLFLTIWIMFVSGFFSKK